MFQITVNGREGVCTQQEILTTGSVGIGVRFCFDSAWDDLTKIAVFRGSGRCLDVALPRSGTATVPVEVLNREGGTLHVGVYGTDGTGEIVIPTVWVPLGQIQAGAYPSGIVPEAVTPSLAEQVITLAGRSSVEAQASAERAAQAAASAQESCDSAVSAAASAEQAALRMEQAADNAGYIWFTINENGEAIFHKTENVDDISFRFDEEGNLVAQYG